MNVIWLPFGSDEMLRGFCNEILPDRIKSTNTNKTRITSIIKNAVNFSCISVRRKTNLANNCFCAHIHDNWRCENVRSFILHQCAVLISFLRLFALFLLFWQGSFQSKKSTVQSGTQTFVEGKRSIFLNILHEYVYHGCFLEHFFYCFTGHGQNSRRGPTKNPFYLAWVVDAF